MYYGQEDWCAKALLQDEGSLTSFVEKSLDFLDSITEAASQSQPLAKKILRPRTFHTERRQKRMEEQAAAPTKTKAPTDDADAQDKEALQ